MELSEILNVPKGKYRVFERDNFDDSYFIIEDCPNPDEAINLARKKEEEGKFYDGEGDDGKSNEIATTFYVINNKLMFLYGVSLKKLFKCKKLRK